MKKRIAIFASGSGTNAEAIMQHFKSQSDVEVALVLSNNKEAFVLERAKQFGVPTVTFNRDTFRNTNDIPQQLLDSKIDLVVLAGFMWLVPVGMVQAFPSKIINIHPALLPKYGGKGMYGDHVHRAVKAAGEMQTGITIHYVNEHYDEGNIIFQASCDLSPNDSPNQIARKVHQLEHLHYPKVIEDLIRN